MLHRFAKFLVACTVLLILAGSLVTSHDSGLSVPDWPTSYGWNMFTFPPSKWVGGILYEHGHRLIASTVGFLTIILAVWLWRAEPRRWLRWLGVAALGAVIAQGAARRPDRAVLPAAAISTAHAGLAEIFFCLTVAIALFTSPGWIAGYAPRRRRRSGGDRARRCAALATATTVLIYTQILVGATMRHTGAGLAIPDFPLMFGHLIPDHWNAKIAIHFAHRVGALLVTRRDPRRLFAHVRSHHRDRRELTRPATLLLALVAVQVTLGALTVLSRRDPLDQQRPRRLRRAGADDVAGADAARLARQLARSPDCGPRMPMRVRRVRLQPRSAIQCASAVRKAATTRARA